MTREALHYADVHVSEILESHGIPDTYIWRKNAGGQIVPQHSDTPIEEVVARNNQIGEIEYQALLKIQERIQLSKNGFILWISPIHPIYYPDTSKIIVTEFGEDRILNRSINTDWDVVGSILVARELSTLSGLGLSLYGSANDVRANPIFVDKEKEQELAQVLEKIISQESIEMILSGEDIRAKERFMKLYIAGVTVLPGNAPRSCPKEFGPTAFQVFSGEFFDCPKCKGKIPSGQGITKCPHCGITKEEYGSTCG